MTTPTIRDIEQISAYLDGQLSQAERARLESRVQSDHELATALDELQQVRLLLRRMRRRRPPRNFMLTPKMAGIRAPIPRAVPALSWASAVAMLVFVFTMGTTLLGKISFGAAAPMMASAPGMGGGGAEGVGGGPSIEATVAPAEEMNTKIFGTPTPESQALTAPQPTLESADRAVPPEEVTPERVKPFNTWLVILPGASILLLVTAFLIRWGNQRAFRKKLSRK